jgi:hypothetical protein
VYVIVVGNRVPHNTGQEREMQPRSTQFDVGTLYYTHVIRFNIFLDRNNKDYNRNCESFIHLP